MLQRLARLSKDSLIYGLGGAAARYTGIVLLPIYTRVFSNPGDYGLLQSVTNLTALLLAIAMLGLDSAAAILYFASDDAYEQRRVATLWVWIMVLVSAPFTILLIVFANYVSLAASGTTQYADLFRLGVAVLPFVLLQTVFSQILRLMFRPRAYAVLNFSQATLVALFSIFFVVFLKAGLMGALWGIFIGTALMCVVSAWAVSGTVRLLDVIGEGVIQRAPTAARLLRLGLPLVPAGVALWVISFSNTYFLLHLPGADAAEQVGVFRVGAQLAAILGVGVWAFQLAWGPFSLSIARAEDAPRVYSRVSLLYNAGAVGASVLMAAGAPILLAVLTTRNYAAASSVIGLLSLAAAALGSYYIVSVGVNIAQRTGQIAWTTLVSAAVNLGLNAVLIPLWGIVGAGVASLAANLTSVTLVYLIAQRLYPLPYRPYKLVAIWLAGSACVAAAGVFNTVAQPSIWVSIPFALGLIALYVAVLFASSAVTVAELIAGRDALVGAVSARVARGPQEGPFVRAWRWLMTRPALLLGLLVALALVLRVGFMAATHMLNAAPIDDELDYHHLAQNLLAGQGYSLDGVPVVNRAPAYPFFLALIYAIFGEHPSVARVAQALVLALLVPLIYYIGKRGWGQNIGLIAAALFTVYPFSLFWGGYLITENLLVALFVLLGALLIKPAEAGPWRLLAAGLVLGLSLLTRPTALPVAVLLLVWVALTVAATRKSGHSENFQWPVLAALVTLVLILVGTGVALSPWIIRNEITYSRVIPFTSGYGSSAGGYVFWISNNSYTATPGDKWGRYVDPKLLPDYAQYTALPNDPSLLDRKGYEYGLNYLTSHPGDVPVLLLGKFLRFWNVFPGSSLLTRGVGALSLLLLPFFLVGLWEAVRKPASGGMLLAFIVGTMLVGLIFWADTRTRAPAEPFILLTSAVGAISTLR